MDYVCWDANCFIGYLQDEPNADVLDAVIRRAEDGRLAIVTSSLTLNGGPLVQGIRRSRP